MKAVFFNRVGDIAFILTIGESIKLFGTLDISIITIIVPSIDHSLEWLAFSLIVAISAKSAQLGLSG
jgi:NADH:ubiquinone oxidoreductase subunit 5 (subunit L)/multisubunit Na+/H+ antiporter MnhA subunit